MRLQTSPVNYPRTIRPDSNTLLTSARAGKTYPAGFIPVLPEDQVNTTRIGFNIHMDETAKVLANAVHVRAHAYFVSMAALDRFGGSMDQVAYAWAGKAGAPNLMEYTSFVQATHGEFYEAVGIHHKVSDAVNSMYVEAYNKIINYRRQQVSITLPTRLVTNHTIARALWGQTAIARIVPTFDAALEQGQVPLALTNSQLSLVSAKAGNGGGVIAAASSQTPVSGTGYFPAALGSEITSDFTADTYTWDNIYAELGADSIGLTLASLEAAKKTQAFARMREKFAGNDNEMIDLLMRGLRIPSAAFKDPILLGAGKATFGISQRYATDAANLDTYVTNGQANVQFDIRMPQQPTGGVIVVTYEIVPEPVFDRMADMFLSETADTLPNALRDTLDVQKVDIVPNRYIDALHGTPSGTFGYQPMNARWARNHTRIGGRFMRTATANPSDEDQQNIWGVIVTDPVLDEDAFLVPTDLSHHVFLDTVADPFKVICNWNASIEGITQFGPALYEASGDYDAVAAEVDTTIVDPSA